MAAKTSRVNAIKVVSSESPLRILVDGRKLDDGGIGTYTRNLITGLLEQENVEVGVIAYGDLIEQAPFSNSVEYICSDAKKHSINEMFLMPRSLPLDRYDVFHAPHFTLPFGIKIPSVVTIHDLIHIDQPERFYYPVVVGSLIRSAIKRANRVLTVSEASYQSLRRLIGANNPLIKKISVIPNAVDPGLIDIANDTTRLDSEKRYLLAVLSNAKPHKGLEDLIEGFQSARNQIEKDRPDLLATTNLVLVGAGTLKLKEKRESLGVSSRDDGISVSGLVSKEELFRLYRGARALVVSSLAEGFCLPVLEAHTCGIPVIARPVPAVMELLTEGDISIKDFSVNSLQEALYSFIKSGESHCSKSLAAQAERFHPRDISKVVLQTYHEAYSEKL